MRKRLALESDQSGFASLVIAITIVIVLSLTTLGFADLMRKEQRNALDKHLSSQAYYAAESGINDAAKAIVEGFDGEKTKCEPFDSTVVAKGAKYLYKRAVGPNDSGISYTCLLINPYPESADFSYVNNDSNMKNFMISGVTVSGGSVVPTKIDHILVSWDRVQDYAGKPTYRGASEFKFPRGEAWNADTPLVRVGLTPIPTDDPTALTRSAFRDNYFAAFLYPNESSTSGNPATMTFNSSKGKDAGRIVNGQCNDNNPQADPEKTPLTCNVRIDMAGGGSTDYMVNLRSIYLHARISIRAYDSAGNMLRIKNAQTVVDSTGKAQDVLKRIQVRIASRPSIETPNFAMETSQSICKQLDLTPTNSAVDNCEIVVTDDGKKDDDDKKDDGKKDDDKKDDDGKKNGACKDSTKCWGFDP